jgi:hypothetical protein
MARIVKTVKTVKTVAKTVRASKTAKTVKVVKTVAKTVKTVAPIDPIVSAMHSLHASAKAEARKRYPKGYVVYEGPSLLTGAPIVAILRFGKTRNAKTGPSAQLWILRADIDPVTASQSGRDDAICGTCPFMGIAREGRAEGNGCYVAKIFAPLAIWRAYKNGSYPVATDAMLADKLAGKFLRLGAYGDPVALPATLSVKLIGLADRHTAYTHSWLESHAHEYKTFLMASCQSPRGAARAQALGWQTFRVKREGDALAPNEIACPASAEAGYRLDCSTCNVCRGAHRPGKVNVAINAHGPRAVLSNVLKIIDRESAETN